ncbi:helix-turn-helix domain-containing protein [Bifidobacterium sp. ESL0790]|uniref:helix-turn-helix domain-containing protein n=1 Tax=Bifidobacterium sp. ESL0790 TaxID=2983233 RepID=UPI0023F67E91|nr:helix-turn-helix domain-containing protein [Bifidobacterium sp. ESL0790]WEV72126.1 helix-turn-helix domain-containing protein [Bifidobacterium sp. ESL0790]
MSVQALSWALDEAPVADKAARLVLLYMADVCDRRGRGSWQSVTTLVKRTRYGRTAVKAAIAELRDLGVIVVSDDQSPAMKLPRGRRPIVYDLCLDVTWDSVAGGRNTTPMGVVGEGRNTTPCEGHISTGSDSDRVEKTALRGSECDPNTKDKPTTNPPVVPQGDQQQESKPAKSPRTELPDGWMPNKSHRVYAAEHGVDLERSTRRFRRNARDNRTRSRNWDSKFQSWLEDELPNNRPDTYAQEPKPKPHTHTWKCRHVLALLHRDEDNAEYDDLSCHLASLLNQGKTSGEALKELGLPNEDEEWEIA